MTNKTKFIIAACMPITWCTSAVLGSRWVHFLSGLPWNPEHGIVAGIIGTIVGLFIAMLMAMDAAGA